jgi:hypothetical protein
MIVGGKGRNEVNSGEERPILFGEGWRYPYFFPRLLEEGDVVLCEGSLVDHR